MTTTLGAHGGQSVVSQIRGSLGPPPPQIQMQVTLANAVTRGVIFESVRQSSAKSAKLGDDEVVLLSRASRFMLHCEGSNDRVCIRLDDQMTNTSFITFPMKTGSKLQWTPTGSVSADAHVIFTAADGRTLSFVDPAYSVNWYVGEWIPRAEEVAYKLADDGFRDSANPPDGLKPANHRQTFTPWYTSPAPTPPGTPGPSHDEVPYHPVRRASVPEERVGGDGVSPEYQVEEGERQRRMDANIDDIYREMNSQLYNPGQELQVLQKLRMVVSVEPKLLCRADMLGVLRRVLEKTADPGTARSAIVFVDEYMHIDDVVQAANSLALYQLMESGLKPARAAVDPVTRNKATEVVKYILDRRGDLRQRPRLPPAKMEPMDNTSFLGKLGATEQPVGTTVEEIRRSARPLPVLSEGASDMLMRIREQLEKRGSNTMKMLGIRFKIMDNDSKNGIDYTEFQSGMLEFGIAVTDEVAQNLFAYYSASDGPKSGVEMSFDQFIVMMRGFLNPSRRAIVHRAFRKMDRDGSGIVDWNDLRGVYNVSQHPKVLSGEFTEQQALTDVLSKYGDEEFSANKDGKLSLAEFEQYYSNVGSNIDTDEYFELMMRQAWQI